MERIDVDSRPATAPPRSLGDIVGEITSDLSTLVRQEIELAKAEMKHEAVKAGRAVGMLGGAGYAGHMTALFVSLAVFFALGAVMPDGWAAVIVALAWAATGAFLYTKGRADLARVRPVPQQTAETLKEDAQWARTLTR